MQTREIVVTLHKRERAKSGQARRRAGLRKRLARLNGWTVAWYALLTLAGVALYRAGAAYALRERGYYAVGGEALALLLPVLYYVAAVFVRDLVQDVEDQRCNGKEETE